MKLAIIAGGKGTRLHSITREIPKPMVKIAGNPILEMQVNLAKRYGITDIYILSGHLSQSIINHFEDGAKWGVNITHIVEDYPLGTAGSIKLIQDRINEKFDEKFMVFYGDLIMDFDINHFIEFDSLYSDSIATILVHPNDHPHDSDLVKINNENVVTDFLSKPHKENIYYRNLVNASVYILHPEIFRFIIDDEKQDFGKDIFPALIDKGKTIRAYKTFEYIKDMGTPDRFEKTERDYISGKVSRLNRKNRQKAIFLDRDGVINQEVGNLCRIEDFELIQGSAEAIKKINMSDYLSIVVTNQPVIAKGFISLEQLENIHAKMESLLGKEKAYLDEIYFCPHHPEKGFEGEIPSLKIKCDCRKPKTGMIKQAEREYNLDLDKSWIIGDRLSDIMAGKKSGLKTILVQTGFAGQDQGEYNITPDYMFKNLKEAVDFIISQ